MKVSSAGRKARNEALFREVNERIRETADRMGGDRFEHAFLCECADSGCREELRLTIPQYEHVRASGTTFLVAQGHVSPEIENVVERAPSHAIVEKKGEAGAIAAELDPRAA